MLIWFFKTIPLVAKALPLSSQLSYHIYNFRGLAWCYFFEQCCFNYHLISSWLEPLDVLFQARWSWSVYPVELVGWVSSMAVTIAVCQDRIALSTTTPPTGQTRTFDYIHRCTDLYSTWIYYRIWLAVSWNSVVYIMFQSLSITKSTKLFWFNWPIRFCDEDINAATN